MAKFTTPDVYRLTTEPHGCAYLPGKKSVMEYRLFPTMTPDQAEELIRRGWRKQGAAFFRPTCDGCSECLGLRIPVAEFRPTRSQRKAWNRNNERIDLVVQPASFSYAHQRLWDDYHADMAARRGWPAKRTDEEDYTNSFLEGIFEFTHDFLYFRDGILVGVGLVDVLPTSLSSVYFFHDPAWRPESPGTFTVMKEIEYAQQTDREFLYLGYWVAGCLSMTYKARFRPNEILRAYPRDDAEPRWVRE